MRPHDASLDVQAPDCLIKLLTTPETLALTVMLLPPTWSYDKSVKPFAACGPQMDLSHKAQIGICASSKAGEGAEWKDWIQGWINA